MDWIAAFPAIIGAVIVIAGWPVVHYFNLRRELAAEKRKLRVSYLIEAYRRIEDAGNRPLKKGSKQLDNMETAIADIQLLGTPHQVLLVQNIVVEFAKNGSSSFDPILISLRRDLRKELELEEVNDTLKFLRVQFDI